MSGKLQELTGKTFEAFISGGPVLVDLWAPWCGPCRMQGQLLEQLASAEPEYAVKIGKVNVDEEEDIAVSYGVQSIPTLLVFQGGKEIRRFVGVQQLSVLKEALKG